GHERETQVIPRARGGAGDGGELVVNGDDYPTPDGTCIRDYVHVEDLADAHVAAVERLKAGAGSLVAHLGYGRGSSIREVCKAVETVTGRPLRTRVGPRRPGDPPRLLPVADRARREPRGPPRLHHP